MRYAAAAAKSLQLCPALCDPIDSSPPGSPVPGILQARTLEWVAIYFSNAWTWKVKVKSLSCVWLFRTPWTAAHQAPPSTGFSGQEYWSGCHWIRLYYIIYLSYFIIYWNCFFGSQKWALNCQKAFSWVLLLPGVCSILWGWISSWNSL